MPGSRLSVDPAEEPPGGGGTAAVLVSCALSLSLIICFLLVVVFWRKNARDPEGRRVPAEEDNRERFVQAPQALHAPLVQGDLAEPRASPQAPAPSWQRTTLTSSNFSHFHTCQMCLERPRSVLTLPCRHACLCEDCMSQVMNKALGGDALCIICRNPIEGYEVGNFETTYVKLCSGVEGAGVEGAAAAESPEQTDTESGVSPATWSTPRGFYESQSTSSVRLGRTAGGQPNGGRQLESTNNSNRWSMSVHHSTCGEDAGPVGASVDVGHRQTESSGAAFLLASPATPVISPSSLMDVGHRRTQSSGSSFLSASSPAPPLMTPASVYRAWINQGLGPTTQSSASSSTLQSSKEHSSAMPFGRSADGIDGAMEALSVEAVEMDAERFSLHGSFYA